MLNINIGILWVVIFGMAQKSGMPHCRKSWTILLSRHLIDGNPDWDNSDSSYHYRSISLRCLLIHWMSLSYWVRTWLSSVECRDVSGCFHWRTWSVLETTGSESTRINCCVDRLDFHRKLGGDCKSCLSLCRTVISPLTFWFSCCIILLYSIIIVDHFILG